MSQIRPRKLSHTGSVLASGLAVDTRLVPVAEARARILGLLSAGISVFQTGPVLIARFRAPIRVSCMSALGTPLIRYGKLLSASPLDPDERETLETLEETAALVSGGLAVTTPLDEAARVDTSLWLDTSDFAVIQGLRPLGRIALEPRGQLTAIPADLRRSFGVAPLDSKTAKLMQALRDRSAANAAKHSKARGWAWFARLRAAAANLMQRAIRRSKALPSAGQRAASAPQPAPETRRAGILFRLQRYLARAIWSSQFGNLLGRQYGKYLARLLDMFDGNDLDNALRYALSLNAGSVADRGRLPFWTPSPREDLSIKTGKPVPGSGLGLGEELYEMLRERYRSAFKRLEARGETDKAAFVLAELLNANEEAVSFLERHRNFRLAAEIAESRNLAPGLVIRLWILAGQRERAMRIARRTGAFADAVLRLEASHKKEAQVLRLLWADTLAESGQYAAAVDAAWPMESARGLVLAWIDKAIEAGGAAGARMLACKLVTYPQEFTELRGGILQFLRDQDRGSENFVKIFGRNLIAESHLRDEVRPIARVTARRLIPSVRDKEDERFVQKLVEVSGDAVLRADLRGGRIAKASANPKVAAPLALRSEPLNLYRGETDRGTISVFDAAELPDGKMLIAVGELGALLLSREGKTIARFSEPASGIVMSDNGDRVILVARRGEIFRLARVDLLTKRQRPWCDARFDLFAPDFDGLTWFVARGGALYAIDALADRWEHLWKVDENVATITSLRRNASSMSAFFKWEGRFPETWAYDYPSLILRGRRQINQGEGVFTAECVSPSGDFTGWRLYNGIYAAYLNAESGWITLPLSASGNTKAHCLTNEWIAMSSSGNHATTLYVLDRAKLQVRARIEFGGTELKLSARIQDSRLTICDDCGRLLVIDLESGDLVREHRVS